MNHEMTRALVKDRQRELTREAGRHAGRRIPRYHVSWSRMSLPAIGAAGRRERSWVIVISATKGV